MSSSVTELAEASQLTAGYVSRLLNALDRDALVDRSRKGEVVAVDYPALLRRWVDTYDVRDASLPPRAPGARSIGSERSR